MWMFGLYLASCTALAVGFPSKQLGDRIVGGENVDIVEVPYQASVVSDNGFRCAASIISNEFLVTSGFCAFVYSTQSVAVTVRTGSKYVDKGGSIHNVSNIILHEDFGHDTKNDNNIGLLKIEPPIVFDSSRQPVKLYDQNEESTPGKYANLTGWETSINGRPSGELQIVTLPIVPKEVCGRLHGVEVFPNDYICAGYMEGGKGPCMTDIGGPLVISGRLAGIMSIVKGCGLPGYPGIYTEVAHHRDWIRLNAKI